MRGNRERGCLVGIKTALLVWRLRNAGACSPAKGYGRWRGPPEPKSCPQEKYLSSKKPSDTSSKVILKICALAWAYCVLSPWATSSSSAPLSKSI